MKPIIYTAYESRSFFNHKQGIWAVENNSIELLDDLFISLREIGKYNGDIALIFYGGRLSTKLRKLIKYYDIKIIYVKKTEEVVIDRYININRYINTNNYTHIIHLDHDMWFQSNIAPLWNIIPNDGVVMGGSFQAEDLLYDKSKRWDLNFLYDNNDDSEYLNFKNKMIKMQKAHGHIGVNGGFMAGSTISFNKKIDLLKKAYSNGFVDKLWGSDEFLLSYYFDINKDIYDNRFNCYHNLNEKMNLFKTEKNEKAVIIHQLGYLRYKYNYLLSFKNIYKDLYDNIVNKINEANYDI